MPKKLRLVVMKLHEDAQLPKKQTPFSSGFDLHALDVVCTGGSSKLPYNPLSCWTIWPGERCLIRTGLALQMPEGVEAQVRPRSGLALKHGITVLNSPGTIDADYTGDVGVILINHGKNAFVIEPGDRIAQLVFASVLHKIDFIEVTQMTETARGNGGYGSTGKGVA